MGDVRPFDELRDSGLLWLINRVVFHPRGFALALVVQDGQSSGWKLLGDGTEVWRFECGEDDLFARANATLAAAGGTGAESSDFEGLAEWERELLDRQHRIDTIGDL